MQVQQTYPNPKNRNPKRTCYPKNNLQNNYSEHPESVHSKLPTPVPAELTASFIGANKLKEKDKNKKVISKLEEVINQLKGEK